MLYYIFYDVISVLVSKPLRVLTEFRVTQVGEESVNGDTSVRSGTVGTFGEVRLGYVTGEPVMGPRHQMREIMGRESLGSRCARRGQVRKATKARRDVVTELQERGRRCRMRGSSR